MKRLGRRLSFPWSGRLPAMNEPALLAWNVSVAEAMHAATVDRALTTATDLRRRMEYVSILMPNGQVVRNVREFVVREYFRAIDVEQLDKTSWRITFYRHPDAARFWKDCMVSLLRVIRESAPGVTID